MPFYFIISLLLFGCQSKNQALITDIYFQDLLLKNQNSLLEKTMKQDLEFWKKRQQNDPNSTNLIKYSGALSARFSLLGDINDLKLSEKIIEKLNEETQGNEAGLQRNLASLASLQHQFYKANNYSQTALKIGENRYASQLQIFDASFELGMIDLSKKLLKNLKKNYEFDYFFRQAKIYHYDGDLEKAKEAMQKSAEMSNGNITIEQIAISNLADLYMHEGDFENASVFYKKSLALDASDYHSIKNLGMIALYQDKNPKMALKILNFIAQKTKSPDVFLDYMHLAQETNNAKAEQKFAQLFVKKASHPVYGNMYNKYLIEIYEGILNNPIKMLEIAEAEIKNRNTAQTKTWLAYALYKNNKKTEAMAVYKNNIAEMPLEGLELYYVAKMMTSENKKYNAKKYFEAAYNNRFELEPKKRNELNNI